VTGAGSGSAPEPEPVGSRTPRWRDADWWFGRTPEQRARRETAREEFHAARGDLTRTWRSSERPDPAAQGQGGRSIAGRVGGVGRVLTIAVTLPIIATLLFGPIGLVLSGAVAVVLLVGRAASGRDGR
jgi:hypothetical protein